MDSRASLAKPLGAAFLVVFVLSLISEQLLSRSMGSGSMAEMLTSITRNIVIARISNLAAILNSAGILVLAAFLFSLFKEHNRILALIAFAFWIAEAIMLAISKVGSFSLVGLSRDFVAATDPDISSFQRLGDFFYFDIYKTGYDIHMLFFTIGGILWMALFKHTGMLPGWFAMYGLVAYSLLLLPVLFTLYDRNLDQLMLLALPYAPFEVFIGLWLLIRGVDG